MAIFAVTASPYLPVSPSRVSCPHRATASPLLDIDSERLTGVHQHSYSIAFILMGNRVGVIRSGYSGPLRTSWHNIRSDRELEYRVTGEPLHYLLQVAVDPVRIVR